MIGLGYSLWRTTRAEAAMEQAGPSEPSAARIPTARQQSQVEDSTTTAPAAGASSTGR
jgi:hypothetical protein